MIQEKSELKAAMNSEEFKNADDNDTAMLRSCFDSLISKEKLREELDKEQHSLCVYCMKRIESSNPLNVKIEHYIISSGNKEIIEATPIKNYFKKIFASEFLCCQAFIRIPLFAVPQALPAAGDMPLSILPRV